MILTIVIISFFLVQCNKTNSTFRIKKAEFLGKIISGTTPESAIANDLAISWSGKVEYPVKLELYMVNADQTGDYQKVEAEIAGPKSSVVLKEFYRFWGFHKASDLIYAITLQEEKPNGKKTAEYKIPVHVDPANF